MGLIAALAGSGAIAQDAVHQVVLVNASSLAVVSLHAVPVDADGDGPDLLARGLLAPGAGLPLDIRPSAGCRYRLRVGFTQGVSRSIAEVDLCAVDTYELKPHGATPGDATTSVIYRHSYHHATPATRPAPAADASPPPPPPPPAPVEIAPGPLRPSPPPPAETRYCPVIGDVATPAECDRVNQVKANLATGSAAFNAPAEMQRRQTMRLRLVIDRRAGSAAPAAAVDPLDGATVAFATKVGRLMRAELSGQGFTVKPLTPAEQDLYAADQAQWEWEVTATDAGDRVLTLKTFVEIKGSDGTPHPVGEINTENRTIHVVVPADQSWSDRIDAVIGWAGKGTNLFKALAGLLGAALALWLAIRKFRPAQP